MSVAGSVEEEALERLARQASDDVVSDEGMAPASTVGARGRGHALVARPALPGGDSTRGPWIGTIG